MSNWKACIPANPKYENARNSFWVMNISVVPHESAKCKVQIQYQNGAFAIEFVTISGDEYAEWGTDDNWIYHKIATKLALGVLVDSDMPYVAVPMAIDDNRSVHNPHDIETINSLQTQLDQQKAKLETIMGLLVKSGSL